MGTKSAYFRKLAAILGAVVFLTLSGTGQPAAACGLFCSYSSPTYRTCTTGGIGCCTKSGVKSLVHEMFTGTGHYSGQQDLQQYYYMQTLWPKIELALKQSADEMRNAVLFSTAAMGAMIDAQDLNQALLTLQKQTTDSLKTETVSDQICRFGTLSRSLANSQDKARVVQAALVTEMQARQLMTKNMNSGNADAAGRELGRSADKKSRFVQLMNTFCDPSDIGASLAETCKVATDAQQNRDVDLARTLEIPLTLNIDFSSAGAGATLTPDEENIFALSSNLYAHNLAVNIGKSDFQMMGNEVSEKADAQVQKLLNFRSLAAQRSVAANSFAALAGMKSAGSAGSVTYMKEILKELGLSTAEDLTAEIGDSPSYYAQMDVLARKLYQSPEFYANLMESPANIGRQQTAMEGVELMQDRDIYESLRRSEMLLSTLLEIYVSREQDGFKDRSIK